MGFLALLGLMLGGCPPHPDAPQTPAVGVGDRNGVRLLCVDFSDSQSNADHSQKVELAAARNETVSFTLQVSNLPITPNKGSLSLRFGELSLGNRQASIPASALSVYQALNMPVDVNRAGYVRHTGLAVSALRLPRALLPMALRNDTLDLTTLRDPADPRSPSSRAGAGSAPSVLWVDVNVPVAAAVGEYHGSCDVLQNQRITASIPVTLTVYDFVLSDERHLQMVGRVEWPTLEKQWPDLFEAVTPHLLNRKDPKYTATVRLLDQLVKLGQQHRADVVIPRLQPQVKWPAGKPPQVDFDAFDGLVGPWLKGEVFSDHVPLGYWPLPWTDFLDRYDLNSQAEYWQAAASHFDANDWVTRCPVTLSKASPGRAASDESLVISARAQQILSAHPKIKVLAPLEEDQANFRNDTAKTMLDPAASDRLVLAAPGLLYAAAVQPWPVDVNRPDHYLRSDLPGLVPYVGAGGDERDVRLWAWLAFLRRASIVQWGEALPSNPDPTLAADPSDLVWFYPGKWFGVDEPLPTVQLKWMRRAEQDYEYLYLAKERRQLINALVMARLITKPVQISPAQVPDPTYALMCGTTDAEAWRTAQKLLARTILLRPPGQPDAPSATQPLPGQTSASASNTPLMPMDESEAQLQLNGDYLVWITPQEKPLLIARSASWGWGISQDAGNWVDLLVGLDIYNASDNRLTGELKWNIVPENWRIEPRPISIPDTQSINTYNVQRYVMKAQVNVDRVAAEAREPVELTFTDSLNGRPYKLKAVIPVAISEHREGRLNIDGNLEDWNAADAIIDSATLVRMFTRPQVHQQELLRMSTNASVYTGWTPENFYVAFKLHGLSTAGPMEKNFVDYQFRRAWGEDLCEVLVQPVYADGTPGPVLHVVCKPRGQVMVESKTGSVMMRFWRQVAGADLRYAADVRPATPADKNPDWRGELSIPWRLINDAAHTGVRPALLRFNFSQHQTTTGESGSWAGPVDFGRDDSLMGLLFLHEPRTIP